MLIVTLAILIGLLALAIPVAANVANTMAAATVRVILFPWASRSNYAAGWPVSRSGPYRPYG